MRKPFLDAVGGLLGSAGTDDARLDDLGRFGSDPGNLAARIHVPATLADRPALVVVLHGCTQTAAGYDHGSGWSRLADRHGFVLLYPEQRRANNANLCFNWFEPDDIARGSGEAASIRQMIEAAIAAHGIDPARVFVTGLSAGGAMASVMLATYPELFAGGAIIAGLPYGCASTMQEAFGAMRARGHARPDALAALVRQASGHRGRWPAISVWHGTGDGTVAPDNADAIVDQWLPLHGIAGDAAVEDVVDGYPRRRWRDADGRVAIEDYRIMGMAHGTPIDARGADPIGVAGPYMLDVAISSTRRIAEGWGLTATTMATAEPAGAPTRPSTRAHRLDPDRPATTGIDVRGIIEDALRAGGLMR